MRNIKIKISTVYIIMFTAAFLSVSTFMGITFNYWMKYIIAMVWCVLIWQLLIRREKGVGFAKKYIVFFLIPFLIMLIHFPIAYLAQEQAVSGTVISRVFSYFLQRCILIATPILTVAYFKKDAIKYTFQALVISYGLYIFSAIMRFGFGSFFHFALTAWKEEWNTWKASNTIAEALEIHDLTFALGFFVLYFLLFSNRRITEHKNELIISVLFMWIGFKRIEIAALVLCVVLVVTFIRKGEHSLQKKITIVTIFTLLILFAFLAVVKNDTMAMLAQQYEINFNGRLGGYSILADYYDLSPLFIGRGYCYTTLLVEKLPNLTLIHSDILKSYIDYGFIGFILWIWFYMYCVPKKLKKETFQGNKRAIEAAVIYFTFTLFSIIIFLTDNVNVYFTYQICYMMIPLAVLFDGRSEKQR